MTIKRPCKNCPFRREARMAYDSDAMQALEAGDVPACHAVVGVDSIFNHAPLNPPEGAGCAGHDMWVDGVAGFSMPILSAEGEGT